MRLLIVTTQVHPGSDANGYCAANVADAFAEQGIEVDILAYTTFYRKKDIPQTWKNHRLISAPCLSIAKFNEIGKSPRNLLFGALVVYHKAVNRLLRKIMPKLQRQQVNIQLQFAYEKAFQKVNKKNRYDAVIATLFPIEAGVAVMKRHGDTPWYLYQLDAYIDNFALPAAYQKDRENLFRKLTTKASGVFTTPVLRASPWFARFGQADKVIGVEFPCVVQKTKSGSYPFQNSPISIQCAFVGTLYAEIRSPQYLVKMIAQSRRKDIGYDFFGIGQELILQDDEYEKAKQQIVCRGVTDKETAEQILSSADILINIDNKVSNQVPSKIFEYMSTGKPVINLYYHEESKTLPYFRQYPLVLNLLMDERIIEENIARMEAFIMDAHGHCVDFQIVREHLYQCTPEYVAMQMLRMIKDTAPHEE